MASHQLKDIAILIADDQKLIQKLVHSILSAWGFQDITVCNSGRAAIDRVSQQTFDLIITDWRMEDLNGIDLLRFVRKSKDCLDPMTPIIFLTGNTELSDVIEARDAGVSEYLIKPFSADDLMRRVRSAIENPRSFVVAPAYQGPDRRRTKNPQPARVERRKKSTQE